MLEKCYAVRKHSKNLRIIAKLLPIKCALSKETLDTFSSKFSKKFYLEQLVLNVLGQDDFPICLLPFDLFIHFLKRGKMQYISILIEQGSIISIIFFAAKK